MKKISFPSWGPLAGITLSAIITIVATSHADSAPPAGKSDLDANDISVVRIMPDQMDPHLRGCIQNKGVGECVKNVISPDLKNANPPTPTTIEKNPTWKDFVSRYIGQPTENGDQDVSRFAVTAAVDGGISRLEDDQVLADPNMVSSDQKIGGPSLWATHSLELIPRVAFDTNFMKDEGVGGIYSFHGIFRMTRRHPIDSVYTTNFWGATKQDVAILKNALPMYLKIPSTIQGSGLVPGEGFEIESYSQFEIGIGPDAGIVTSPLSWYINGGIFANAGFITSWVRGHFKTNMEVQTDNTLRVKLERINEDTEKLDAQVNAGVKFSPFSIIISLANIEAGVTHSKETVLDMTFDTSFPEAKEALKKAYLGSFKDAQNLALHAEANYKCVRFNQQSKLKRTTKENALQVFTYNNQKSNSATSIDSIFSDGSGAEDSTDHISMDEFDDINKSGKKNQILSVTVRKDSASASSNALNEGRTLILKVRDLDGKASLTNVKQFIDLAKNFAPADQQSDVAAWNGKLSVSPAKQNMKAYFYLAIDSKDLDAVLQLSDDQLNQQLTQALAKMGAPTDDDHLKHTRTFLKGMKKAIEMPVTATTGEQVKEIQSRTLVKAVSSEGFDLYSAAALATLVDSQHLAVFERLTLDSGSGPSTLEYSSVGTAYVAPRQVTY